MTYLTVSLSILYFLAKLPIVIIGLHNFDFQIVYHDLHLP